MKGYDDLDKRLSLLEQKLDLILENHLSHIQSDMNMMKKWMIAVSVAVLVEAGYIIAKFNGITFPLQ